MLLGLANAEDTDSLGWCFEVHETIITSQLQCDKEELRQQDEKKNLLKRLDRWRGLWDSSHPRYRLLTALYGYRKHCDANIKEGNRWRDLYKHVPDRQKELLEKLIGYTNKLNTNDHLIWHDRKLHSAIVQHALEFYEIDPKELEKFIKDNKKDDHRMEKVSVSQALKHYVRDWSNEGEGERMDAFPCILNTLCMQFPDRTSGNLKVLLPGAGLGRLGHDIHSLGGFEVTINEWSMFMNVAYRYLESLQIVNSEGFHPFVDAWSHHATTKDLQRRVLFPDQVPSPSVLLVEGDFTTVFRDQKGSFDSIVTLFFIDTARNLISYFETIHQILKPEGIWINFGPLLYGTAPWVQLTLDEIVKVAEEMGFEFLDLDDSCGKITLEGKKVRGKHASYAFNERALNKNAYQAQAWVVRKKAQQ
ncbi:N2227-domain-containing protein [Lojkania enalia]|uniref:N2227-domain-containing protein n=1 Tax=Lojkania enalia TaxID=147567 RepID=A0A9P4N1E5_9PLEO|nr:N2227-domain-containing protein [Didymosphaeria enalia]